MLSRRLTSLLGRRGYGSPVASTSHSYATNNKPTTQVVVADEGRTLVCWHPEPEFPYEHSLPLPKEAEPSDSALKSLSTIPHIKDVSHLEGMKEELAREQLMKMTFTTKHRWFPNMRRVKAIKGPVDRPYL